MKPVISCLLIVLATLAPAFAKENGMQYVCPMHPHYQSHEPGNCPICGMDLVPGQTMHHGNEVENGQPVVHIDPKLIQNMGVRTEQAQQVEFGRVIRSYGMVMPNERLQKRIHSRVEGWITDLGVSAEGDTLEKGAHSYTIHSPDLVIAQHDLLMLERSGRGSGQSKLFVHYDVDKAFVDRLRRTREVQDNVAYYSPYQGTVSRLNVRPGSYVTKKEPLMILEDYSSLWVQVNIAEQDLQFLQTGTRATVTFPPHGNYVREGGVDYIYPTIDPATRTGKVRLVLDNADGVLKPGAYADVVFEANVRKRLSVASGAILPSSKGSSVILALGDNRFQPREVITGIHSKGRTEILSGIAEGDRVVVSGQFLIDSESSLRGSFRRMEAMDGSAGGGGHAGH